MRSQISGVVPATFMRGGTSKGLFFDGSVLPERPEQRDELFLRVLGSPDPFHRQLDGLGGGSSSLSKVAVITPSAEPGHDVDYTFGQVAVDQPLVDYSGSCGNLASAVAPFALHAGLWSAPDGSQTCRIRNTNTGKRIDATVIVSDGRAREVGDLVVPGVAVPGSPIRLDFWDPAGSRTGSLLPTGHGCDELIIPGGRRVAATLIDAGNPAAYVDARELGLSGLESPAEIEARPEVMHTLELVRRAAAVAMRLAEQPDRAPAAVPKVGIVSPPDPRADADAQLTVRMLSMGRVHRALPITVGLSLAAARLLPGTVPAAVARQQEVAELRAATPSGVITVGADLAIPADGPPVLHRAWVMRTARILMDGVVHLPHPAPPSGPSLSEENR